MFLVPFSQLFRCQHNLRKLNNPIDENYHLRRIVSYQFLIWFVNSLRIKNSLPPLTLVACAVMWSRWYLFIDLYLSRCWWWYLLIYTYIYHHDIKMLPLSLSIHARTPSSQPLICFMLFIFTFKFNRGKQRRKKSTIYKTYTGNQTSLG